MPAKTVPEFQHNVRMVDVINRITTYFAVRWKQGHIYKDTERSTEVLLSLYVDEDSYDSRINVQEEIFDKVFPSSDKLMPSYKIEKGQAGGGASSLGAIIVGTYGSPGRYVRIALRRVGQASAGIGNEDEFVKNINHYVSGAGAAGMTILFKDKDRKQYTAKNIVKAIGVGKQRKGKEFDENSPELWPKSDVNLEDSKGNLIPVSIKQNNAEFWASVESWHYPENQTHGIGHGADWYIKTASNDPNIPIDVKSRGNGFYTLVSDNSTNTDKKVSLTWKASKKMREVAAFGSDIQKPKGNGFIVKKTFSKKSFKEIEDSVSFKKTLVVQTDQIIKNEDQIGDDIYVLCYYTQSRGAKSDYKGVSVKVATKSRAIGSGKNRVLVELNASGGLTYKGYIGKPKAKKLMMGLSKSVSLGK